MFSHSEIDELHRRLEGDINRILSLRLTIRAVDGSNWPRAQVDSVVTFDLVHRPLLTISRVRGHEVSVVPIGNVPDFLQDAIYASWWEEWTAKGRRSFSPRNFGWTFFRGIPLPNRSTQIMRAEWDHRATAPPNSAQPHWQFDIPLTATYQRMEANTTTGELVELHGRLEEIELSGLHLAMGGWMNAPAYPSCWRVPVKHPASAFATDLGDWAGRTLSLARDQFPLSGVDGLEVLD